MPNAITLSQLQAQHGTPVDTRASAFYNGWPQTLSGPSGHEPAALNLAAAWLSAMSDEQIALGKTASAYPCDDHRPVRRRER
jgi:thiosulfate/3-mercaptopyruvate sulfurtransferase